MIKSDTVTFQTTLVPSRETAKAYFVLGGQWLPKSQARILRVIENREIDHFKGQPARGKIAVSVVEMTVASWLIRN